MGNLGYMNYREWFLDHLFTSLKVRGNFYIENRVNSCLARHRNAGLPATCKCNTITFTFQSCSGEDHKINTKGLYTLDGGLYTITQTLMTIFGQGSK